MKTTIKTVSMILASGRKSYGKADFSRVESMCVDPFEMTYAPCVWVIRKDCKCWLPVDSLTVE